MRLRLFLCVAVAVLAALVPLRTRVHCERANRDVDVILQYQDLVDFCQAEGLELIPTLDRFKKAGVTALVYSENALDRMMSSGRVSAYAAGDLARALRTHQEMLPLGFESADQLPLNRSRLYLLVKDADALNELQTYLKLVLGPAPAEPTMSSASPVPTPTAEPSMASRFSVLPATAATATPSEDHPVLMELATSQRALMSLGLGFSRQDLQVASNASLHIYLRPQNRARFSETDLRDYMAILGTLKPLGVHGLIFEGSNNEVLGFPDNLKITIEEMRKADLLFGNIEVPTAEAAQKGSRTLGIDMADKTVRVMSVAPAAVLKLTPADAVDRFLLGVRERNIRVVYVRFFPTPDAGKSVAETNLDYVQNLTDQLRLPPSMLRRVFGGTAYRTAAAKPFPPISPGIAWLAVMSLGAAAAALLLLAEFGVPWANWQLGLLFGSPLLAIALVTLHRGSLWAKLLALEVALVFPVLGLVIALPRLLQLPLKVRDALTAIAWGCVWLTLLCAGNVLGGVIVAGSLSATPFMLETDQFRGIKFIMVLAPFLVVYHYLTRSSARPQKLWDMASTRVVFWHLGAMAVLAAALMFYVARTGNTSPATASDLERTVRNLLESLMVARPRFKEFFLGHPALLVLAVLCWTRREATGLWVLVLAVAIGQVDVIDTFCHIHTPYLISLLRVMHGWWLGTILGSVAAITVSWLTAKGVPPPLSRSHDVASMDTDIEQSLHRIPAKGDPVRS